MQGHVFKFFFCLYVLSLCCGGCFSSIADDVTVVIHYKEQMLDMMALEEFVSAVPSTVKIIFYPMYPLVYPETVTQIEALALRFPNLLIAPKRTDNSDLYNNAFQARRRLFSDFDINTRFIILSEYSITIDKEYIESSVQYAKDAQAYEQETYGKAYTTLFVSRLMEKCRGSDAQEPHTIFTDVKIHKSSESSWYLNAPGVRISLEKQPWYAVEDKNFKPESMQYLLFVEDHITLWDTEVLRANLELYNEPHAAWQNDQHYLAWVTLVLGKRIQWLPHQATLYYFCDTSLEVAHLVSWRRSEFLTNLATDVHKEMFSLHKPQPWKWGNMEKDKLFNNIKNLDLLSNPYYSISERDHQLRHANLLAASLLMGGLQQFEIRADGDILLSELNPQEFLTELYKLYNSNQTNLCSKSLSVRGERIYNRKYIESRDLPNLTDTLNPLYPHGEDLKTPIEFKGELPGYCLYHTGRTDKVIPKYGYIFKQEFFGAVSERYDYFMVQRYDEDDVACPKTTQNLMRIAFVLVEPSTDIPIPNFADNVLLTEFHYFYEKMKPKE